MKISKIQMEKLAAAVLDELKASNQITFKVPEAQVYKRVYEIIKADFTREEQLDREVNAKIDELEQQNLGEFQRYKMFPLLKKKMAKEKGIIL